MSFPDGYWDRALHIYFRDRIHGGFGVLRGNTIVLHGPLNKQDAAAIALILNEDRHLARGLLPDAPYAKAEQTV